MNIIASNQNLTMSSREIADLTDKEHKTVMRDIRVMLKDLGHGTDLYLGQYSSNNRMYDEYNLPKRETLLLVSGYMLHVRVKIVDRLEFLESQSKPQIPQNFAEALQLAANQAKALELAAPKVAFVDNLVDRTSLMNASQVAQKHKKSAIWLNKVLTELKVYNKAVKRGKVFQQWFIDKGYGEMKQSEEGYSQAMFTNAGEVWINEKLHTEGIV
ncbi:Rha family regulatory protein [Vibrio phage 1.213.O._10N.222.54.F10]|nr:Rha family regulatory protein [Vibrio phage 1.213.O._10N.222.54.F10]